ncbi:MAG: hypothetical protein PHE88_12295 [Elusimicrobia bacterium]|nr:hypothetical protein [Elusimicrobiota bacterium]
MNKMKPDYSSIEIRNMRKKQALAIIEEIANLNGCSFDDVIEALEKNVIREQLSIQLHFQKTGELPV